MVRGNLPLLLELLTENILSIKLKILHAELRLRFGWKLEQLLNNCPEWYFGNLSNCIYLGSTTTPYDDNLEISGYKLIRSHDPPNNKFSSICIYYKNVLALWVLSVQYLQEYINFEDFEYQFLNIGGKICNFIFLYRSPRQIWKILWKLENKIGMLVSKSPIPNCVNWRFKCQNKNWFCNDKSSHDWNAIENVTALYGLIIKKPSHVSITSLFCSDPTFTSQSNLITKSGIRSSLHPSCNN